MRERPDSSEGIHVQVSVDGVNWYSPNFKSSNGTVTTLTAGRNVTNGIKHYVSGTGPQRVVYSGLSNDYDHHQAQEWRHYAFLCNYDKINSVLDSSAGNGYWVRIIQRGYHGNTSTHYDQWALCDITFQGPIGNSYTGQAIVDVPIDSSDVDLSLIHI